MKLAHTLRCMLAVSFVLGIWPAGVNSGLAVEILVDLDPVLDRFGSQIETVQIYEDASGQRMSYAIYDTGASVITVSAYDQMFLGMPEFPGDPIPIKVPNGAGAEGIGGTLTGDVSQPGTILAAGIEAMAFIDVFPYIQFDLSNAAFVPGDPGEHGVQVFVGTQTGSASLPTITGTPIHNGRLSSNPGGPNGVAAKIDMQWGGLDLGALLGGFGDEWAALFAGITLSMPNVEFVAPGTTLQKKADDPSTPLVNESTTAPVRIPLALYGEDNHEDPGDSITYSYNPFQNSGVVLSDNGATIGGDPANRLAMLFDTGAALSIVSTEMALDLGFDPDSSVPEFSVEVQGAAGGIGRIPGFTIDFLELPVDDDGDGTPDGSVRFTNVPVFVYDVTPADTDPEDGLDGILGMNLFNTASEMLYDPSDSSLSLTFLNDPYREVLDLETLELLEGMVGTLEEAYGLQFPSTAQFLGVPGVRGGPPIVPEPSTLALLATGGLLLLVWRRRRAP